MRDVLLLLLVVWNIGLTYYTMWSDSYHEKAELNIASHMVDAHRNIHNQIMIREAKFNLAHPDFDHKSFHEGWVNKGP